MKGPRSSVRLCLLSAAVSVSVSSGCALGGEDELAEPIEAVTGTYRVTAVGSGASQEWRFEDRGGGEYEIVGAGTGQERWNLEALGDGYYRVRSVESGGCLDLTRGATGECSASDSERFTLELVAAAVASPLGSGWVQYSPNKKIHLDDNVKLQTFAWTASKSVCSPHCAEYKYDAASDTETFRVIDNRSNRSEIRLQNEYSSGTRQFQGYVTFSAPLNDESLFQIFGSTSGATQLMLRGYSGSGGSIRGGGKTVATGIYGVEQRINVIHRQGNDIRIYVNGSLKHKLADDEAVSNYMKYGCYGTLRTGAATVKWRAARVFRDGQP